ncbi:MAG TPA: pyridoxal-dependent decarboxylase [Planctomycetota bacterium]|nr:pyridoxal-dependent decarboxylase [Planctomycetota bacterium]
MTIHDDPRFHQATGPAGDDDPETFRRWGDELLALLQLHLEESRAGHVRVLAQRPIEQVTRELELSRWIREGGMDAASLGRFVQAFLADSTRLHHPACMGHQVAAPHFASALADLVHGTINNSTAIYEMGAPSTAIECAITGWMVERIGFLSGGADGGGAGGDPDTGDPDIGAGALDDLAAARAPAAERSLPRPGGVLTHGGSLANLTALLAARARIAPDAWTAGSDGKLVVIAPSSAHYSISRAVGIMGLGTDALLALPVDRAGRAEAAALPALCDAVAASGRRVMAVVASAVSTAAGVHDPLAAIADVCEARGLWLHVDGAHGASALLSPALRGRLAGIERADSVVWDAHKLLRTSALCAAALFRDVRTLDAAFRQQASYVGSGEDSPGVDLIGRAVECTKSSLGLKLFLVLAAQGEAGLGRHVESLYAAAARFHDLIAARPGFQCLCPPESNILCFRWAAHDDAAQAALRAELVRRGEFYITQADVGGQRWLRLTIMNPNTDESVIARLLTSIESIVAGL